MRTLASLCLATSLIAASVSAVAAADTDESEPLRAFRGAVTLVEDYRHDVLALQTEAMDAPHLALPGTFDATVDALRSLQAVEVDSCFAEWWAHEFVSLKLSALFTLYMQEDTTDQVKVDLTGWLADRLHQDADRLRSTVLDDCA